MDRTLLPSTLRIALALMLLTLLAPLRGFAQRPTLLSFPDTPCDSTSCSSLFLTNDGASAETLVGLMVRDSVDYAVNPSITLPATIDPQKSLILTVCFSPGRRGGITDSLRAIIQTASGFDTIRVRLIGRGIGPDLAVSPSVLNFSKTNPGSSLTLTMKVVNNGERPYLLDATSLVIPPPFRLVTPLPVVIVPGDSVTLQIAFEPQQRGVYSEQTNLIGGCNRQIQIGLNGVTDLIGTGAVLRISKVAFNPANQEQISCDVSLCDSLIFSNVGTAPLIIDSIRWADGSLGYTFDPPLATPFFIPPNSQRVVRVCLNSKSRGTLRDTLIVRSNTRTSIAFGMVIDVSKSMEEAMACTPPTNRMAQAIVQAQNFIGRTLLYLPTVGIQDQLVVQTFTSNRSNRFPFALVPDIRYPFPLTYIDDATRLTAQAAVGTLVPIGGTPTGEAMMRMMDELAKSPLPNRVIVLLTDGDANDEGDITVQQMVNKARSLGIRIFPIGLGLTTNTAVNYLNGLARGTSGGAFNANDCGLLQTAFEAITDSVSRGTITQEPFAMKVISPLLITSKSIDFDSLYIGDRLCRDITMTNIGEGESIVDAATFSNMFGGSAAEFTLDPTVVLPLRIAEGGQATVRICFEPEKLRNRAGTVHFRYNSCGDDGLDLDLSGVAYAAADLRINDWKTGLPGDVVRMPVYADTSLAGYEVDTITYQVRWNKSMLDLRGVYPGASASGSAVAVTTPVEYGDHYATVGITSAGKGLPGGGELAQLEFQVLRGDSLRSLVEVIGGKFQDNNPQVRFFNAGIIAFDSTCFLGAKPIHALGGSAKVVVGDVSPTPAADRAVSIGVTASDATAISVAVYAADGSVAIAASDRLLDRGGSRVSLDIVGLASGSYYTLLRLPSGESIVRKFLVSR